MGLLERSIQGGAGAKAHSAAPIKGKDDQSAIMEKVFVHYVKIDEGGNESAHDQLKDHARRTAGSAEFVDLGRSAVGIDFKFTDQERGEVLKSLRRSFDTVAARVRAAAESEVESE